MEGLNLTGLPKWKRCVLRPPRTFRGAYLGTTNGAWTFLSAATLDGGSDTGGKSARTGMSALRPGGRDKGASRMSILSGKLGLAVICISMTECARNWN